MGGDRDRGRRGVLRRCRPQNLRAGDHEVPKRDRGEGPHRDRRLPTGRRHPIGVAKLAALQASHRGGERVLYRRRDGDARRLRYPSRVPGGQIRGDGTQTWTVRRRRYDRSTPAPNPVAPSHGVLVVRRSDPRRAGVRDGAPQRGRAPSAVARQSARIRGADHRQRAARGAGNQAERAQRPVRRRGCDHQGARRGPWAARRPRTGRHRRSRNRPHGARRRRRGADPAGKELRTAFEKESRISSAIFQTEDAKEGPRAFAEKRPPVWKAT